MVRSPRAHPAIRTHAAVRSGHVRARRIKGTQIAEVLVTPMTPLRWTLLALVFAAAACAPSTGAVDGDAAATINTDAASDAAAAPDDDASADAAVDAGDPACVAQASRLQDRLDQLRGSLRIPDALVATLTPRCGLWTGVATDPARGDVVTPDQLVRIGSITKTFVGAAALLLADRGTISLDDPIARWVSDVPNGANITLRHLMSHTSGLFNYTDDARFNTILSTTPLHVFPPRELLDLAFAHPPYFAPGAGWHYANTNFILLGVALEHAAGMPLARIVRTMVLDPAHLPRVRFDGAEMVDPADMVPGYANGTEDVTFAFDLSWAWAAGAIVSSVGDLTAWARALYNGSVLPAAARAQMLTFIDTNSQPARYGLAAMELGPPAYPARMVGHTGGIPGYATAMFYLPDRDAVVVVASNNDRADVYGFLRSMTQTLLAE